MQYATCNNFNPYKNKSKMLNSSCKSFLSLQMLMGWYEANEESLVMMGCVSNGEILQNKYYCWTHKRVNKSLGKARKKETQIKIL